MAKAINGNSESISEENNINEINGMCNSQYDVVMCINIIINNVYQWRINQWRIVANQYNYM